MSESVPANKTKSLSSQPSGDKSGQMSSAAGEPVDVSGPEAATGQQGESKVAREIGGPQGPEPTRFGDWERKGRCIDF